MADLVTDMRRAYRLKGDTYSSMEVFGMLSRGAAEIERLRAALKKIADDDKNCAEYCRRQATRALGPAAPTGKQTP